MGTNGTNTNTKRANQSGLLVQTIRQDAQQIREGPLR